VLIVEANIFLVKVKELETRLKHEEEEKERQLAELQAQLKLAQWEKKKLEDQQQLDLSTRESLERSLDSVRMSWKGAERKQKELEP